MLGLGDDCPACAVYMDAELVAKGFLPAVFLVKNQSVGASGPAIGPTANSVLPVTWPYGQCRQPDPQQYPRLRWYAAVKTIKPFSK